ncbi:hypothetical protein ACTNDG_04135 [Clostridium sp. HCP1S3_B4]|uniref:hypothetical protein n=1 Tax=unclassified Clostridium TaxID=2614128 RepID=UPI002A78F5EC|nr:hypothetical protein [Clostridiales bacterium]MDY2730136.1 hypothetical protein [Clostridium sp.]
MPAIWNVNNGYGINNKKVSSKLTFEVGEKFAGRISSSSDDNEVTVKLTDGWEFSAKLQDAEKFVKNPGLMQFQVTGFEGGKINLSILKKSIGKDQVIDDRIKEFALKEGLTGEDISLLRSMIEHDISLTRDNITFIKSLIDFNKKINNDSKEIDDFIQKYIESKGVDMESEEGKNIKSTLTNFLNKFKGMSKEDILLFIENNIDLNEENIDSFNKLFKGNETLKDILDSVKNTIETLQEEAMGNNKAELNMSKNNLTTEESFKPEVNEETDNRNVNKNVATKLYEANEGKSKLSMLGLLKSIAGDNDDILKEPLREILNLRSSDYTNSEYKNISGKIEVLNDNDLLNMFQKDGNTFSKNDLEKVISNILEKNITLSDSEASKVKEFLSAKISTNDNSIFNFKDGKITFENNNQNIIVNYDKMIKDIKDIFVSRKNDFQGNYREIATDNIKNITPEKIQNLIKENLNKYNVVTKENFNKIVSDIFGKDTMLIKDEVELLRENIVTKNIIENENIPKDSSKTQIQENNSIIANEFKDDNNIKDILKKALESNKNIFSKNMQERISQNIKDIPNSKLSNIIKEELIKSNENVDERVLTRILNEQVKKAPMETVSQNIIKSSKDIIKDDLNNKINNLKDVVKEIIQKTDNKSTVSEKVLQFVNSNINDFKLFNSISNEYYYLDVPISNNNKEYPCKLIIKDKRKDGKKIDRTNIKMVVAVKTINIGNIDGYLYVRNNKLDVNLKCEKSFVKILSVAKDKLQEKLNSIGFYSDVTVSDRKEEVNLSSCREFFSDTHSTRIDTKV